MSHVKGTPSIRNSVVNSGKQSFLPPKSPFPNISSSLADYAVGSHSLGSKGVPGPRHQRTTSESFLIEEQPSWLDDLLNEPETPIRKGAHHRSSSDSFAYLDALSIHTNVDRQALHGFPHRTLASTPSWGSEDFDYQREGKAPAFCSEGSSYGRTQNIIWESDSSAVRYPSSTTSAKDNSIHTVQSNAKKDYDSLSLASAEKQDVHDFVQFPKSHTETRESQQVQNPLSEGDHKRTKQQFAQRSRVRKLQYIAELEKHVQALQVQKSQVSSDLKFLDDHNFFLNYENVNLKQKLEVLRREQVMKCMQHDMLERELARLRTMYQRQQQQEQQAPTHFRSISLDSQFANLSLGHHTQENRRGDPFTGPLLI